jgi:hypothetical protein
MRAMTRAHLRAHWIGPPSPTGLWIGALLRVFAMLVLYAASIVRMRLSLFSGECHTDVEPETLPEQESGIIMRKPEKAAASSHDRPAAARRHQSHRRRHPPSPPPAAAIVVGGGSSSNSSSSSSGGDCDENALVFPPAESPAGPRRGHRLTSRI